MESGSATPIVDDRLATSANWDQRVTVTLEMYEPGEPHPELGPEEELDATGIFPQLVTDQLSLRSDAYEYFWLPFAPRASAKSRDAEDSQ